VIFRGSVVQAATPDRFRGRVMAVDYVVGAGVPRLGNFEAGAVASLTSPAISAISGGLGTIAGALLIRLAFPPWPATTREPSPPRPTTHPRTPPSRPEAAQRASSPST